jgi:hypothetical protein
VPPGEYARVSTPNSPALSPGHTQFPCSATSTSPHTVTGSSRSARAGLIAVFPLWGSARRCGKQILRGHSRALVCVDTLADARSAGAMTPLLAQLPPACARGEGGEFHTFVFDAPGFDTRCRWSTAAARRSGSRRCRR